ncbi:hypothetical protein Ocepr_2355 (plasmid) [Oceanithermus profundus DSM 14977]|uniref:Prepilin-type N-terminal cleavage/methylation domain-containing protein n=1 Tax=Oceanithermus profundus (strain DSM 14977 / NBRC 100410 / VKM B-2274 / 506) TaxID=670487 RepID=E4UAM4_OCEP5|nr:type II secretion system protein [Oceanithermus profundus]ADR37803.1 hypothetical protein Ocepr_2355 [Oceanithermus profundus DSM 14977]
MRKNKGFTMIELMVVIGILAILMAFLLPRIARAQKSGNDQAAISYLREISQAEAQYRGRTFTYTGNIADLQALEPPLPAAPTGVTAALISGDATGFCAVARHDDGTYWHQATQDGIKPMSVKASAAQPTACE